MKKLRTHSTLQISYFIFFAALPFIYSDSFIDPVLIPRQSLLTLFLLFIWSLLLIKRKIKDPIVQISNLSLLLISSYAMLIVLSFTSIMYSNTISESIYVASKYGIIFLFFITTYFLIKTQLLFKEDLIIGVFIFCIISLLYGIYDIFLLVMNDLSILSNSTLITATHANKNLFASVLLLCFWAIFFFNISRSLKYVVVTFLAVLVLLIQSKIVTVGFIFMFLMLALKNIRSNFKENKIKIISVSFLVLITSLIILINFSKFANLSDLHTLNTRYSLWVNSFEMIREHPFGVGAGNWQIFFPKYGLSHFDLSVVRNGMTTYQRPHNDFIWMLCELGFQGLIMYLSVCSLVIIMLVRSLREKNNSLPFLLLITIIGYCMVSFFDFPLERIEHQVLLSVIILLSMNSYDSISNKLKVIKPLKYSPIYILLICVSLTVCYYRLKGEYFTREFISLNKAKHAEFVIENCDKAKSLFYTMDATSTPIDWYASISLFSQNKFEDAKIRMELARKYAPYNIHILKNLGVIHEKQGDTVKAKECYNMALSISPQATINTLK